MAVFLPLHRSLIHAVFVRVVGGEAGGVAALAPKCGPLGLVRSRTVLGHLLFEYFPLFFFFFFVYPRGVSH